MLYVMDAIWRITTQSGRILAAERMDGLGGGQKKMGPLWTLTEFCRRSGKSRRQIYRDIQAGRVRPLMKLLDTWLVEPAEITRLKPPPAAMAALFPEHDAKTLDYERDRELVLARVLRYGGAQRLRWAVSFYGRESIRQFIEDRGAALLDPRSFRFWRLYFGVRAKPVFSRRKGLRWGGRRVKLRRHEAGGILC